MIYVFGHPFLYIFHQYFIDLQQYPFISGIVRFMNQLIEKSPEDNPRLNEIYQILLLAGYFRIRIVSLKAFDKIVGGVAWCITSSNFEIDIDYNDEMTLGQKIKVSEVVCASLVKMKCPYTLQPFQLQGLDINNIFPIVQWLVKFVYETRLQRQKYDRQLSLVLGKPITHLENKGNPQKIVIQSLQKTRINRTIQKTNYRNPIRVYSALLQYNDATANKMYNKLLNIMAKKGKSKGKKGDKSGKGEGQNDKQQNLIQFLNDQNEQQSTKNQQNNLTEFGNANQKLSLQKLEKIIMENKNQIQEGIQQHQIDQDLEHRIRNQASNKTEQAGSNRNNQGLGTNEDQRWLKQAKNQNKKYQQKIQILKNQLLSFQAINSQLQYQINQIRQKNEQAESQARKQIQKNDQYRQAEKQINEQLKINKNKVSSKLEKLAEKRQTLKYKKGEIKKKAKTRIDQLNYEVQVAQASVPQIDEQAFKQMLKQAEMKKQIYDKKYQQLTFVNQQLAILQRKAENYTSPPQIAQYHQRFVQLFESINVLIEEKRSMFSQITNLQSLKKVIANYSQIMNNMKVGYTQVKKKSQLKELNQDVKQIRDGLLANMKNSQSTLAKIRSKRQSVYGQYMDLIKMEREYLHLLRMLKIQYENAAKMYN